MYICSCNVVTDGQIKKLVASGEVCTMRDLREKTKCSTKCGMCLPSAKAVLAEALAAKAKDELEAPSATK